MKVSIETMIEEEVAAWSPARPAISKRNGGWMNRFAFNGIFHLPSDFSAWITAA